MATKAQQHKANLLAKIYLCVLVSWWRKCFARVSLGEAMSLLNDGYATIVPARLASFA